MGLIRQRPDGLYGLGRYDPLDDQVRDRFLELKVLEKVMVSLSGLMPKSKTRRNHLAVKSPSCSRPVLSERKSQPKLHRRQRQALASEVAHAIAHLLRCERLPCTNAG